MNDQLLSEIAEKTQTMLLNYPDHSIRARVKNRIKRILKRPYTSSDLINWPNGMLGEGIFSYASILPPDQRGNIFHFLETYYTPWFRKGMPFLVLDDAISGDVFLRLFTETGNLSYKEAADALYHWLLSQPKDAAGAMLYRPGQKKQFILADTLGMVCPFLSRYGSVNNNSEAVETARCQILCFLRYGFDERTGLPYHGYVHSSGTRCGLIGWGRAVGWIMSAMAYYLKFNTDNEIREAYISLTERVFSYQRPDHLFSWLLPAMEGEVDTSCTMMILDAVTESFNHGLFDNDTVLKQELAVKVHAALISVESYIQNGYLTGSLSECIDFAMHPQVYGTYPWGQGTLLSVLCKIRNI